jgi:repressor LexA
MKGDCLMQKMPLTPKQHLVLKFLEQYYNHKEYMPTYREIAEGINVKSTNSVFMLLNKLEDKGHIKRFKHSGGCAYRAIELISN